MSSTRLAMMPSMVAVSAVAVGMLAGCGGSGAPAAGSATRGAPASGTGAVATGTATTAPAAAFVPIVEPFDPGHPALATSSPASCGGLGSTLAIEQCYEGKTESTDAAIDAMQQATFQSAAVAQQAAHYQFSIDYSHLRSDPNAAKGGGWVCAPGAPVAVWRQSPETRARGTRSRRNRVKRRVAGRARLWSAG